MVKVLPSLLAGDFLKLGADIKEMEAAGADIFHLDIMDGQFVPNISYGIPVCEAIAKVTSIPLDVNLMTYDPSLFFDDFINMGVDMLSFHIEATPHAHRAVQLIKSKGMKAGIALNPQTSVEAVRHLLSDVDFVLIMTVNPGCGGQGFIDSCVEKLDELVSIRITLTNIFDIEVDSGINGETAEIVKAHGANLLVSGYYLFKADDKAAAISALKE